MAVPKRKELRKIEEERTTAGELKWIVIPYPCNAHAQEANMDLFSYAEFVKKSLFLDRENPIEEWFRTRMRPFVEEYLLSPASAASLYFDQEYIRRMLEQDRSGREQLRRHIYLLVSFEMWHRTFLGN